VGGNEEMGWGRMQYLNKNDKKRKGDGGGQEERS
jgi:hypothetical protein